MRHPKTTCNTPRPTISKPLVLLAAIALFSTPGLAADPVLDLIERGRDAYESNDYKLAHEFLQEATAKIHEKIGASFEAFLPEAPSGWSGEKLESSRVSASGTSSKNVRFTEARKRFTRESDGREVEVYITNFPQMVKGYQSTFENMQDPMVKEMMAKQGYKAEQKDEWDLLLEKQGPKDYDLYVIHKKQELIVQVLGAENESMAKKFLGRLDLKGLAETAQE